ncbi:MAG: extracellular solute-binding protein [Xenococcaceae cyanobacterium]
MRIAEIYKERMSNRWFSNKMWLILATLLLAACSSQSKLQSPNKQPELLQGQILVWEEMPSGLTKTQNSKIQKRFRDTVEKFTKLYPRVKVVIKLFPSRQILKPFELQVKRGAGPDLLLVYSSNKILRLIKAGTLRALDDSEIDQSQFRVEALKQARYQGQLYGLPIYLSTQVLCYNKDKVKELPRTLPELIEQARRGYSVGLHSGFTETFWGTGIFGGQLFDAQGRVILAEGGGWVKWMEWLKEAQNEPNFILSDDAQALQQAFVEGKLAYLTCRTGWIPYFGAALGKDKLGATLLPGEANQPATPVLFTGVFLFNRASSPNQNRLALKLAQFLTNVQQQKRIEAAVPFIPSKKKVTFNRDLFPLRAALLDQSRTAVAVSLDNAEKAELIEDYGEILYQQVLAGEIAPDEAATKLTQTVKRQFGW